MPNLGRPVFETSPSSSMAKVPIPSTPDRSFATSVGDPEAARLVQQQLDNRLPEVVIDKLNFLPSVFLRLGHQRTLAVCRIVVGRGIDYRGESLAGGWKGTGFLVGPKLLLTNHHVLNSIDVAREATCQFNYLVGPDGKAEAWAEYRLVPEELFLTSPYDNGLDYTFVSIEPSAAAKFGTVELERAAYVIHPGTYANIIQHPDGRPQEIVLQDNEVVNDDGVFVHYVSDTDYGSSGSPVFDNAWKLIGLHHARKANDNKLKVGSGTPPDFLNEGIKIATIATDIEQRAQREGSSSYAATILKAFKGINSISGFFGTLGRASPPPNGTDSAEIVVDLYKGTETDIDVGFWNIEWFSNRFQTKTKDVATIIADFNLDIWALAESSPAAAQELVDTLKQQFKLDYAVAHSEPNAGTGKQSTSVLWNTKTVAGKRLDWPADIADWFTIDSRDFDDSMLEAVHGRVFDRYPGLFQFNVLNSKKSLDFYLVPLHLKAMDEGSLRRGMATKILGGGGQSDDRERCRSRLGDRRRLQRRVGLRRLRATRPQGFRSDQRGRRRQRRHHLYQRPFQVSDRPYLSLAEYGEAVRAERLLHRRCRSQHPGLCEQDIGPQAGAGAAIARTRRSRPAPRAVAERPSARAGRTRPSEVTRRPEGPQAGDGHEHGGCRRSQCGRQDAVRRHQAEAEAQATGAKEEVTDEPVRASRFESGLGHHLAAS